MRLRSTPLLCVLTLISLPGAAATQNPQSSELDLGGTAPELRLTKLLQAPEGARTDWSGLRGKVVVLEFWATWCAPCIAAMPHLNDLSGKFRDKPVRFISITDEVESVVVPFLKRRPMKAWVGLDTGRSTMKSYSVKFFPTTVVIDTEGKIAAIMQPKTLTENMLSEILEGRPLNAGQGTIEVPKAPAPKPPAQGEVKPLFAITIKPIKSAGKSWGMNPGSIRGSMTLKTALSLVHDIPETRIICPAILSDSSYEISASMTEGHREGLKSILGKAIEASLKLRVHRELREMEVFLLTAPKPNEIKLRPNQSETGHWSDDEGVLAASAAPIRALHDGIEAVLKRPVFDETSLKGKYDWDVLFDAKRPDSIIEAVSKDLGLELTTAKRKVEVLVVEMD